MRSLDRQRAPGGVFDFRDRAVALVVLGQIEQPLGRVGAAVEQHILDAFAQRRRNVLIDRELAGIDDAHVHARLDGVEQEHRMHRLAHRLVAAEREGEVRDAARDMRQRHFLADDPGRLDEGLAIFVMLFDAGGDREDVGIEDDVFRREADLVHQHVIGALADLDLALARVGLAHFVERHHHDGGAEAQHRLARATNASSPSFSEMELTMACPAAFQAGLDHAPFGAVDHQRHRAMSGSPRDQ